MGSPALGSEMARKSTKGARKELIRQMSEDSMSATAKSEAALDDGLRYILTGYAMKRVQYKNTLYFLENSYEILTLLINNLMI